MARLAGQLDAMKPDTRGRYVGTHPDHMVPCEAPQAIIHGADFARCFRAFGMEPSEFDADHKGSTLILPPDILRRMSDDHLHLIAEVRAARRLAELNDRIEAEIDSRTMPTDAEFEALYAARDKAAAELLRARAAVDQARILERNRTTTKE